MIMLYKVFFNQLQPYTSMIPDNVKYFMLKRRTPPIDYYYQLLSEVYTCETA